jgi:glycosyltransferase involved in cell wall biosynthesis
MMTDFSIVIPCYNEEEAIPALLSGLVPCLEQCIGRGWEIIFVDDGSRDRSLDLIGSAHASDRRIKAIALSRNFGHQAALSCGLSFASGEIIGVMDCDLQDTPEVLLKLYSRVKDENFDVCYGVRGRREASTLKNACYRVFYRIMRALSEHPWPEDAGDFSVFNRRVHRAILSLPETVRVLRGLRSWVGFRQTEIAVERPQRKHGTTKYNFFRLWSLALSSLTGFSYVPLRMASMIGMAMGFFSLLLATLFLLNRWIPAFTLFGYNIGANPGTTTIILFLAIVSSMLFFCLGIMGEYLVVLLKEVKGRPIAIAEGLIGDLTVQAPTSAIVSAVTEQQPFPFVVEDATSSQRGINKGVDLSVQGHQKPGHVLCESNQHAFPFILAERN